MPCLTFANTLAPQRSEIYPADQIGCLTFNIGEIPNSVTAYCPSNPSTNGRWQFSHAYGETYRVLALTGSSRDRCLDDFKQSDVTGI